MKHQFNKSILRKYDIRGIVGDTLFPKDAYVVGLCFGTIIRDRGGSRVSVGRDGRLSSPDLSLSLIKGLVDCGVEVFNIGVVPTPVTYFSEHLLATDGTIMITGSHNPIDHNGFKMTVKKRSFYGDDIENFAKLANAGIFASGKGTAHNVDISEDYLNYILSDFTTHYGNQRPLKVAWDAGNGVTGEILKKLVARLPGEHITMFTDIDGTFPNHHPDPVDPENLVTLRKTVLSEKCDLGIAFDGDGDRVGIIDDKGNIVWGDQQLILYSEEILKSNPGAKIIADVKASQVFFDEVKRLGGTPIMWRTGHSFIKQRMLETGALLAGEMSGHIFFKDRYYGFDDALYAATRAIGIVSTMNQPLSTWFEKLPKPLNTPELRITCSDEEKFQIVQNVVAQVKASNDKYVDIDGIRVSKQNGWWLLRASNTGDHVIARIEADNQDDLNFLKEDLSQKLSAAGIELIG